MLSDLILSTLYLTLVNAKNPASSPAANFISSREIALNNRYENSFVNDVFKDNILLNISYLKGDRIDPRNVEWEEIRKPFSYEMRLNPGEVFAFHDGVLSEFAGKVTKTTNAHFNHSEGFKTDGYLFGDGVCHLASLMNWVAREAKLEVKSPTSHDFALIPDIPRDFGVSIYSNPENPRSGELQNLYIKNTLINPVVFVFDYNGDKLKLSIAEVFSN